MTLTASSLEVGDKVEHGPSMDGTATVVNIWDPSKVPGADPYPGGLSLVHLIYPGPCGMLTAWVEMEAFELCTW